MPGDGTGKNITIRMPDEDSLQTVRTILAYEAAVRCRKPGQALEELIMEAVDTDSYPPEVRARLDEIASGYAKRSVERFLRMSENNQDASL